MCARWAGSSEKANFLHSGGSLIQVGSVWVAVSVCTTAITHSYYVEALDETLTVLEVGVRWKWLWFITPLPLQSTCGPPIRDRRLLTRKNLTICSARITTWCPRCRRGIRLYMASSCPASKNQYDWMFYAKNQTPTFSTCAENFWALCALEKRKTRR